MQSYEYVLCHHGVKGMKWGVRKQRKSSRITVRQAYNNARAKEYEARREEIQNSKGQGMTARRAMKNANKAGQAARRQSIYDDRAYNQQLRGQEQSQSWMQRNGKKLAIAAAGTAVAVTGAALVAKYLKSKGATTNSFKFTPNFTRFNRSSRGATMPIRF